MDAHNRKSNSALNPVIIIREKIFKQIFSFNVLLTASWYIRIMWTNMMHYLLLIYFNNKPLHVSIRLAAHRQEDRLCIKSKWYRPALCWLAAANSNCYSHALCWLAAASSNWYSHALCWLAAASQHNAWLYQLLFIRSRSSWWWASGLLETCRGLLLKLINCK